MSRPAAPPGLFPRAWLNGRLVELAEARVSVLDHGLLYGDACFEALRVYRGHPAFWRRHLARLARSASLLELPDPGEGAWREALAAVVRANRLEEAMVRLTLTRGPAPPGLRPGEPSAPTRIAVAVAPPAPPARSRAATARWRRIPPECLPAAAKSGNYLPNLLARRAARRQGCDEALFTDAAGRYLEGTVSNLFWVTPEGQLATPPLAAGILPGITREVVLAEARALGLAVVERCPTRAELLAAREAFLTGTGYEVTPLEGLDGDPIAQGPVAPRLAAAYREAVARDAAEAPLAVGGP